MRCEGNGVFQEYNKIKMGHSNNARSHAAQMRIFFYFEVDI